MVSHKIEKKGRKPNDGHIDTIVYFLSNPHVFQFPLDVISMSHARGNLMISAAHWRLTLWTSCQLHRHPALPDRKGMSILAIIPVPCPCEFFRHRSDDDHSFLSTDSAIECRSAKHFFGGIDLWNKSPSLTTVGSTNSPGV